MKHLALAFALLVLAAPAHAAQLQLIPAGETVGVERSFVVSVHLLTEGENINAVEGSVLVPSGVVIDRIETGGSALTLWVEQPRYVIADGSIQFTGGVPGNLPDDSLLFTVFGHARNAGDYVFSPGSVTAYLSNGEGTERSVSGRQARLTVEASGSAQTAPKVRAHVPIVAAVGADASVFEGQYFLALYGGDQGKGVDRYEVREGWWRSPVVSGPTYVLKDQSLRTTIWVSAVAADGSKETTVVLSQKLDYVGLASLMGLLAVLGLLVRIVRRLLKS